ncbi:MAG: hypothetical protein KJ042_01130 [Deltaproteobacteria bacterium]|nr:hypothetical protein [Deltaproteobacteria bacterium]
MTRLLAIAAAMACAYAIVAGPASATSVIALSDEQVFAKADVVARGRVISVEVKERVNAASKLVTVVTIDVSEAFKGVIEAGHKRKFLPLVLEVPGGTVGDIGVAVMGAPVFEVGDEVVVAAERAGQGGATILVGFFQGRYTVLNPTDATPLVVRDPWRENAKKLAACSADRQTCLGEVAKTVSLDQIRRWSKVGQ